MVITAGPPCPDFSRLRTSAKGTDGDSGRLFQHMLDIEHALRLRFRGIPTETVIENVVPHPSVRENLFAMTTALAMDPVIIDAADGAVVHRKRLWWTSIERDDVEAKLTKWTPWSLTWSLARWVMGGIVCTIRSLADYNPRYRPKVSLSKRAYRTEQNCSIACRHLRRESRPSSISTLTTRGTVHGAVARRHVIDSFTYSENNPTN